MEIVKIHIEPEELTLNMLKTLNNHVEGAISGIVRDYEIKYDYKNLRKDGHEGKIAREMLASKYFISIKTIEKILYAKQKKKYCQEEKV